jgi:iron complex outermembrane receptor protein
MRILAFAVFAALSFVTAARAEGPSKSSEAEPATTLEAVVVEGQTAAGGSLGASVANVGVLGELPLIEAPYSVSVVNERLLEIQQSTRYTDYLKNVPGTNVGNVAIGFFSMRGFAVGTDGYLYDGLPGHQGISETYQLDSFERIEVFKGPAAFLSGFGGSTSLGGTLNYVPKRAQDEAMRSVEVDYANRSLFSGAADLGQRFGAGKPFGIRINARYRDGEQQAERYDWTQKAASLALDWRATQNLSFAAHLEYADNHLPELPPFFAVAPGIRVPDAPDASDNLALSWDEFASTGRTAYLRGDWTFLPDWTLTTQAQSSRTQRPQEKGARFGFINDEDGNATLFGFEERSRIKGDSGQALVRGKLRTGPLDHQLTFGYTALSSRTFGGFANGTAAVPTNLYDPADGPEPADESVPLEETGKAHGTSFLASDILDVSERWSVLLAARRASFVTTGTEQVKKTSPTGALMFKPVPGALLYLNYSEGLEQGSRADDLPNVTNAGQQLKAVVTEQVELGGKLEWRGVTYTLALFELKRPLEQYVSTGEDQLTFVQAGEQRHRGVELTAIGRLTENLEIFSGAAYIDPKTLNTGDPATDGQRPPSVPRVTLNVFADYRAGFVRGLFFNAGAYHNAKQYLDAANTQSLEGWTRFDVGARYETTLGATTARFMLGVENVADRDYWIGQAGILTIADPLTIKLSSRIDF